MSDIESIVKFIDLEDVECSIRFLNLVIDNWEALKQGERIKDFSTQRVIRLDKGLCQTCNLNFRTFLKAKYYLDNNSYALYQHIFNKYIGTDVMFPVEDPSGQRDPAHQFQYDLCNNVFKNPNRLKFAINVRDKLMEVVKLIETESQSN